MKYIFAVLSLFLWIHTEASVPITLEYAITPEQQTWGLMQRTEMAENHGMLFIYPTAESRSFWMFNTLIDLSIAFLDDNKVIKEICELKAYPEIMDPYRPVKSLKDFRKYPLNDPILLFYEKNSVCSSFATKYILEMGKDWFAKNNIKKGDRVQWDIRSPYAYINRSK